LRQPIPFGRLPEHAGPQASHVPDASLTCQAKAAWLFFRAQRNTPE